MSKSHDQNQTFTQLQKVRIWKKYMKSPPINLYKN